MSSPVPSNLPDIQTILKTPTEQLPRNTQTEKSHNNEVWWQIYFPLLLGLLVSVGVCGLSGVAASTSNGSATKVWADVSLVFLIIQFMAMVFPLLLIFAIAFGLGQLLPKLPPYFKVAQDYSAWLAYKTAWAMKFVTEPVLQIKSGVAGLDSFIETIRKFVGR